jgi:hypothetical protein
MSLIQLKARVKLYTESELDEWEENETKGIITGTWKYRKIALPAEEIHQIIYSSSKRTLIHTEYFNYILVDEPFDVVYAKWKDAYPENMVIEEDGEEENNGNDEKNSDDEEG